MINFFSINLLSLVKFFNKTSASKAHRHVSSTVDVIPIVGNGEFEVHVVGESSYLANFESIFGPCSEEGVDVFCKAFLIPEPENPYDKNAVRVTIAQKLVGYLARPEAKKLTESLKRVGRLHMVVQVDARVRGGWYRNPDTFGHFGVMLDFPDLASPAKKSK